MQARKECQRLDDRNDVCKDFGRDFPILFLLALGAAQPVNEEFGCRHECRELVLTYKYTCTTANELRAGSHSAAYPEP